MLQGAGPRMYLKVKGQVYWGGRQGDGLAQGCIISTLDLPLALEVLIHESFYRLRRRQLLNVLTWTYADDIASVHGVPHRGTPLHHPLPPCPTGLTVDSAGLSPEAWELKTNNSLNQEGEEPDWHSRVLEIPPTTEDAAAKAKALEPETDEEGGGPQKAYLGRTSSQPG